VADVIRFDIYRSITNAQRVTGKLKPEVDRQIQSMLRNGIMPPPQSPLASHLVCAVKDTLHQTNSRMQHDGDQLTITPFAKDGGRRTARQRHRAAITLLTRCITRQVGGLHVTSNYISHCVRPSVRLFVTPPHQRHTEAQTNNSHKNICSTRQILSKQNDNTIEKVATATHCNLRPSDFAPAVLSFEYKYIFTTSFVHCSF